MKRIAISLVVMVCACSSKDDAGSSGSGSGSAPAGSGSAAAAGSDTTAAGSGSATAGSAVATGSGSGSAVAAGSGSAASGSAAGSGSATPAKFDFDKLTDAEKADFMKKKVMPGMKVAFQGFDKKKFATFDCRTCHGKDPKKSKFKMPNPALPKLDFAALKSGKQAPKMAKFMAEHVTPDMAKLFERPMHSESNPDGFGCLACHVQKK